MRDGPAIVISASGMLAGGRILHHLKKRLPDPRNMVVFSGYQAEGTKGRFLQDNSDGIKTLRIHHKEVELAAEIVTISNLSAHADYEQLLSWLKHTPQSPQQVLINHGQLEAQDALAERLQEELGWKAAASSRQTTWDFL
jgi:metallo-beta-lactamase family protein